MSDHHLDAKQLLCPLPVIRTQDTISTLSDGDVLTVTCTDPGTLNDLPAWCRIHGHELTDQRTTRREFIFSIKVHKLP